MDDERSKKRKAYEDGDEPDVEAHKLTIDDSNDDDPERKRKRKGHEDVEDDELGRKRK